MPQVPNFVGREEQMDNLRKALDHVESEARRRIATLWGEGGIGKTQLVLHYAEERRHGGLAYIFWVNSENSAAVDRSFSAIAVELNLPGATGHGNHINNKYWVLQFLDKISELEQYPAAEEAATEELTGRLGGLPLALFFDLYVKYTPRVHAQSDKDLHLQPFYSRGGLHGAYQYSFKSLNGTSARELFRVLCIIGPDAIPLSLFQLENSENVPESLEFCRDEWDLQIEVEALLKASLVRAKPETSYLYVHGVIQVEFHSTLSVEERRESFMTAAKLLYEAFPKLVNGLSFRHVWKQCESFASHVVALCQFYETEKCKSRSDNEFDELVKCLDSCAWYLRDIGDYNQNDVLVQFGFEICRDKNSPEYASLLNTAGIIVTRNNIKQAYQYHNECLRDWQIRTTILATHINVIVDGMTRSNHNTKALRIDMMKPEYERKQIINIRHSNIAEAFIQKGEYDKAIQNLGISRQAAVDEFGEDTFYDADVDFIMGHLHYRKGEIAQATLCYTRACMIYSSEGASSMQTVAALYKVDCVHVAQRNLDLAVQHLKKALELAELNRNVKGDGEEVARVKRKYAEALSLRREGSDEQESRRIHEEPEKERKSIQKPLLGEPPDTERNYNIQVAPYYRGNRHPNSFARLCSNVGRVWAQRGNFSDALAIMEECRGILEGLNADLYSIMNNLGNLHLSMGSAETAFKMHSDATAMLPRQNNGAVVLNELNLGRICIKLGRFEEAKNRINKADKDNTDANFAIHIKYYRALLFRAEKKLSSARDEFQATVDAMEKRKDFRNLLHAICLFKQGLIPADQGDKMKLEKDGKVAAELLENAEKTRRELQGDKFDPQNRSQQVFDSLVDGQLR
ncbi:TPR-like protein [Mytilinidion resinicola]|uniref:TPR-like protein n=1 Tax=Mytilinidion resinicola TaxID=574789 RepID=A0A6A6YDY1_9PEZI|nr:TPR-like protein [Mytilinidion resinicola]KAF2807032.1 TPR-like protein [Mytilinidion resinicola]